MGSREEPPPPSGPRLRAAGPALRYEDLERLLDAALARGAPRPADRQLYDLPDEMARWPVEGARRPLPPKLPDDVTLTYLDLARHLAAAYAAAYEVATGKPYWPFRRGPLSASKHADALVRAATLFVTEGVRPGRWVLWAFDCWRLGPGAGKPRSAPPPGWVFAPKALEKLGWFQAEEDGYGARVDALGPRGLALAERWMAMRRAVAMRPLGADGRAVARDWFPGDSWPRAVAEAQAEARAMQETWDRRARAGEWLWGC